MTFSEKIKTIDNKIDQFKAQYNSDRQAAKILVLWSGNVGKFKSLAGEDFLPEKKTLRKNSYNQKIWIFTIRYWVQKTN